MVASYAKVIYWIVYRYKIIPLLLQWYNYMNVYYLFEV
jgi:hypothetical protein